jgi:Flp pilus assembly pilin Flp
MKLNDLRTDFRARLLHEQGQTMAEYGVVLTVITIGIILAIAALSGGITTAINAVTAILP